MRVLVTGASGFLGQEVVGSLLRRGHHVRAIVRPASTVENLSWKGEVELFHADLRTSANLVEAFQDVDVVVHLAACVVGDDETRFVSTVVGTERLLEAMKSSQTKRIILASSYSVYDYARIKNTLTEDAPLEKAEGRLYQRDSYAIAKVWQENLVRRYCLDNSWDLCVLRPGFIWGGKNQWIDGLGVRVRNIQFVIAPLATPPLTHVKNCADCFAASIDNGRASHKTFNIVDGFDMTTWKFVRDHNELNRIGAIRIPVPYWLGYGIAVTANYVSKIIFGRKAKLPGLLIPCRYRARFKPLTSSRIRLQEDLGWIPPLGYSEALRATRQ